MAITLDGATNNIAIGANATGSSFLRLYEDTDNGSNYIDLTAPSSFGSNRVLTLPDATTTLVGTDATQTLTNKTIQGGAITSETAKAFNWNGVSTNTFIDFTSIPSWVKRITVMFSGVSSSGSSAPIIQIGSGSVSTSGYTSIGVFAGATNTAGGVLYTTGFGIPVGNSATLLYGHYVLTLLSSNTWICSAVINSNVSSIYYNFSTGGVSPNLTNALDRVRITTVNGTDTFDAGTVNILYE